MKRYPYLIVGGGMCADAAIGGIRQHDKVAEIGLFSDEHFPPYNRPPLSKGLWKDEEFEVIWRRRRYDTLGVEEHLTTHIASIDRASKTVIDSYGNAWGYEKLLLAVGASSPRLPYGDDAILYYRTLDDYFRLWDEVQGGQRFLIIGGGFIGAEIAAALRMHEKDVTM
ncbi:MAG: FAD-dependent oxidoreductase, partial [Firmicutes bacterium]|nr:FAD-dependent oxidoreductase [Bacillota bacterium]